MATMILKSRSGDKQIEVSGQVVAGRNEDCDLVLSQGHPSRRHAQITAADDGVWLEDLGSTNGTYLNDRKVEGRVKIEAGDRVRFDAEEYEVVGPPRAAEPDPNATVLSAPPPDPNATVLSAPPPPRESAPPPAPERPPAPPQPTVARSEPPSAPSEPAPPRAEQAPPKAEPAPPKAEPAPPKAEPAPAKPEPAAAKAPEKPAAGPEPREPKAGGGARRPGAWADPDHVKEGGTVLLDPEQLKALMGSTPSPEPIADADAPYLVVTAGAQAGSSLKLTAGAQTNIWDVGRDEGRDIRFDEDGVSGFHAKIVNEGARWKVIDQMSANGTLVNEKRGTISFLSSGDRIRFGPVECVFQLPAGSTARPAPGRAAGTRKRAGTGRGLWGIVALAVLVAIAAGVYFLLAT